MKSHICGELQGALQITGHFLRYSSCTMTVPPFLERERCSRVSFPFISSIKMGYGFPREKSLYQLFLIFLTSINLLFSSQKEQTNFLTFTAPIDPKYVYSMYVMQAIEIIIAGSPFFIRIRVPFKGQRGRVARVRLLGMSRSW